MLFTQATCKEHFFIFRNMAPLSRSYQHPPPEGFRTVHSIKQNTWGWCQRTKQSLLRMLTNPAYIGHWVVKDVVVRWNNHPPIVDEATFYLSFNRHSSWNLDGSKNTSYRDLRFNDRPSLTDDQGIAIARVPGQRQLYRPDNAAPQQSAQTHAAAA